MINYLKNLVNGLKTKAEGLYSAVRNSRVVLASERLLRRVKAWVLSTKIGSFVAKAASVVYGCGLVIVEAAMLLAAIVAQVALLPVAWLVGKCSRSKHAWVRAVGDLIGIVAHCAVNLVAVYAGAYVISLVAGLITYALFAWVMLLGTGPVAVGIAILIAVLGTWAVLVVKLSYDATETLEHIRKHSGYTHCVENHQNRVRNWTWNKIGQMIFGSETKPALA